MVKNDMNGNITVRPRPQNPSSAIPGLRLAHSVLTASSLQKINQRYIEASAESTTLQELVVNELKTKKHVATEGLLWLTRYVPPVPPVLPLPQTFPLLICCCAACSGLEFMCLALNANVNNKTEELSTSFRNAYGTTLKPHHSFVVKPLFSAAMSACPARNDFYKKLGDDEAKVQELMTGYLSSLDKIVGILKGFVNSKEAKW